MALSEISLNLLASISDRFLLPQKLKLLRDEVEARLAAMDGGGDAPSAASIRSATVTINFAPAPGGDGFAALANGVVAFSKNLGAAALPANARFAGVAAVTFTGFDNGGGGATYVIKVGSASDDDAVIASLNVATGQTGFPKTGTLGARGFFGCPLLAEQLVVVLTSNADLNDVTAGAVTTEFFYFVKAA